MNAEIMMVDPNELVIDLPLSEAKIRELWPSITVSGVMQPVFVWLNDMRIIDGFHRTETARRIGITSIPVLIRDCNEEEFWSARIVSARAHHAIEAERLAAWMDECWKQTKWHVSIVPDKDGMMPRAYSNTSVDLRMVEMVWTVFGKKASSQIAPKLSALTDDERELRDWVLSKSQQWGVGIDSLVDMFLRSVGIRNSFLGRHSDYGQYDQWAREYNLNLKQRMRLQKEIVSAPGKHSQPPDEIAEQFISQKIANDVDDGESYLQFADRKAAEAREAYRKEQETKVALQRAREQDPAYLRMKARDETREASRYSLQILQESRNWIRDIEPHLAKAPDGPYIFSAFVADMTKTFRRLWPTAEAPDGLADAISQAAQLATENDALKKEIDSLKRALASKSRVSANSVALPSSELKRICQ